MMGRVVSTLRTGDAGDWLACVLGASAILLAVLS